VLDTTAMAAASHPGTSVLPLVSAAQVLPEYIPLSSVAAVPAAGGVLVSPPRRVDHPLLEMAVGRLLEWVVSSVEGLRDRRLHRGRR
jgi:hypothetical protein